MVQRKWDPLSGLGVSTSCREVGFLRGSGETGDFSRRMVGGSLQEVRGGHRAGQAHRDTEVGQYGRR